MKINTFIDRDDYETINAPLYSTIETLKRGKIYRFSFYLRVKYSTQVAVIVGNQYWYGLLDKDFFLTFKAAKEDAIQKSEKFTRRLNLLLQKQLQRDQELRNSDKKTLVKEL